MPPSTVDVDQSGALARARSSPGRRVALVHTARYFIGLGATGFGGPIALAERMRHDLVETGELAEGKYREGLALAQLSPGPLAAQLLYHDGLVTKPVTFATNKLIVLVPRSNPAQITSIYDLRRSGVKVVIGDRSVPIGAYTRQLLDALGITDDVMRNVVSQETDVKSIVTKVALGEADAGLVYATDAKPVASRARSIKLPAWAQPLILYQVAVVNSSSRKVRARAFIRKVTSIRGRLLLKRAGFGLLPRKR